MEKNYQDIVTCKQIYKKHFSNKITQANKYKIHNTLINK